jgi:hypothetical protein
MIDHFSVSQLSSFQRCPLQYFFSYIEKMKRPLRRGGRLVLGRGIHYAFEQNFSQKIESRKDLTIKKILEHYDFGWQKSVKDYSEIGIEWEEPEGELKDEGIRLTKVYREVRAPHLQPIMVEQKFTVGIGESLPNLVGVIDLSTEKDEVIDLKVSKIKPNTDMLQWDTQLRCYTVGFWSITKRMPKAVGYDYLRRLKFPRIETMILPSQTEDNLKWFLHTISKVIAAIQSGIFYPTPSPMVCSWCGFYRDCEKYEKW